MPCPVDVEGRTITVTAPREITSGEVVEVAFRPERAFLSPEGPGEWLTVAGTVRQQVYLGTRIELHIDTDRGRTIVAEIVNDGREPVPRTGDAVRLRVSTRDCIGYPKAE
jgi:ABC-type Fe3+/spermidine/putrescine transport system ATPase subunit